ncbi:MAG: 30S ribosome-binding factor RbfA [Chloroflexi bacterium]|nr:30S ribosome-binding factor RbfA [Chloroflexota bacterium]
MSHRIQRINHLIRNELSGLLRQGVKDPRLGNFVAITEVITTPDLRYARIFVSFLGDQPEKEQALNALASATGFFRSHLAKSLKLRRVPELSFHWDDSIERGERLMRLIDQVSAEGLEKEEPPPRDAA